MPHATLPFQIVDVFAEQAYAGNQLGVVAEASDLTTAQMQAIAHELNFSETTFVTSVGDGSAEVRIFTPDRELPFAGHPTLGTAWVLRGDRSRYVLELGVGSVPVDFVGDLAWMTCPPSSLGETMDRRTAARLVGLSPGEIARELPVQLASNGPDFVIIPVVGLDALQSVAIDRDLRDRLLGEGLPLECLFLFSEEPYDDSANYAARMFFDSRGLREDAATGSANAVFAAYLLRYCGPLGEVVVEQGVEIQRPSRLYLKVAEPLQVGGKVHAVAQGTIRVPPAA